MAFVALLASVATAIFAQFCNKRLVNKVPLVNVVNAMFGVSMLCGWILLVVLGGHGFAWSVAAIGGFNAAVGMWAFLRAVKINLSRTIIFLPLINTLAILLSAIFLGEWHLLFVDSAVGFVRLFGIAATLLAARFFAGANHGSEAVRREWLIAMGGYILIAGTVNFLIKYFATEHIALPVYLASWYTGSFIGSFFPQFFEGRAKWDGAVKIWWYVLLGFATIGAMAASYWGLSLAPAAYFYPLYSFLYAAGAALVGLFIFKEREQLRRYDYIGFALGIAGSVCLLVSMR